jgi:hypothetical protein
LLRAPKPHDHKRLPRMQRRLPRIRKRLPRIQKRLQRIRKPRPFANLLLDRKPLLVRHRASESSRSSTRRAESLSAE